MMQAELECEQLDTFHGEIYGFTHDNSPICIQLEKLDRYIKEHGGKSFKPDMFDTFEYI